MQMMVESATCYEFSVGVSPHRAIDAENQEVAKLLNLERADQASDVYLMDFDVSREKAEARMVMGGGFPNEFVSILCVQNA